MVAVLINLARVVFEMRPFENNGGSRIGSHKFAHEIKKTPAWGWCGFSSNEYQVSFFLPRNFSERD